MTTPELENKVLENADNKVDDKEYSNLKALLENKDFDKRKFKDDLNVAVSEFLNSNLTSKDISDLFVRLDGDIGLNDSQKSQLKLNFEKLFEQAKTKELDDAKIMKLREINGIIDATKFGADELESQTIIGINSAIDKICGEGNYQEAVDVIVYIVDTPSIWDKLSSNDKGILFGKLKFIIQRYGGLKIKNQKIKFSETSKWVKKMQDNADYVLKQGDASLHEDVSLQEYNFWELDTTKAGKDRSEKSALKVEDKELARIMDDLNAPSAMAILDEKCEEIFNVVKNPNAPLSYERAKDYIKSQLVDVWGYQPKNGKELKKSEVNAFMHLFQLESINRGLDKSENALHDLLSSGEGKAADAYKNVRQAEIAGVSVSLYEKTKDVINNVDMTKLTPEHAHNVVKVLIGDNNGDGKIINQSTLDRVTRDNVDKGTVFGGQIATVYENACKLNTSEVVVSNIVNVIKKLHGLENFSDASNIKTETDLCKAFKENPAALIAFRNKILSEGDMGMRIFGSGSTYAESIVSRYRSDEERKQQWENYVDKVLADDGQNPEIKEQKDKLNNLLNNIRNRQEEELGKALASLKELKNSDDYKNNVDGLQQAVDEMIACLEKSDNLSLILDSDLMQQQRRALIVSGLFAGVGAVENEGEWTGVGGLGLNLTSEKLNKALDGKWFNNISFPVGAFFKRNSDGKVEPSLGIGLTASGEQKVGSHTRVFYGIGAGGAISLQDGTTSLGLYSNVGIDWNVNNPSNSLNDKAAHHLGVAGSFGVGFDLNSGDIGKLGSIHAYWHRDKLEGVEQQAETIKSEMGGIFDKVLQKDNPTFRDFEKALKIKFPKSSGDVLTNMAIGMYNIFSSYKDRLKELPDTNNKIKEAIFNDLSSYLAQNVRNEKIEKIIDEGLHLSTLKVGVSVSWSKIATFFLDVGVGLSRYTKSHYEQDQSSFDRAVDGLNKKDYFEAIGSDKDIDLSTEEGQLQMKEKIRTVNELLGGAKNYLSYEKGDSFITLNPSTFTSHIDVMCHPELAPYIHYENGVIKLPINTDISLGKIVEQTKEKRVLILGAKSAEETENIIVADGKLQCKPNGDKTKVWEFGKQKLEDYNLTSKEKTLDVVIDGKPNQALVDFVANEGESIVKFRNNRKDFVEYIERHPDRGGNFVQDALKYVPDYIKNNKNLVNIQWTADDIRFLYASLSRVRPTMDKQLDPENLSAKAEGYWDAIKSTISVVDQGFVEGIIKKLKDNKGSIDINDTDWKELCRILIGGENGWLYARGNTEKGKLKVKLLHLLAPTYRVADARTAAYRQRIHNEYKYLDLGVATNNGEGFQAADALLTLREESINKLKGKNATQSAAGSFIEGSWIGAVAGYEGDRRTEGITDKFVGSPKMIQKSLVDFDFNGENKEALYDVMHNFLMGLQDSDKTQFDTIIGTIIGTLEKSSLKSDRDMAKALETSDYPGDILIDFIKKNNSRIKVDMKYGLFSECVNETILFGGIQVTTEEQVPAENQVYYYEAVVSNNAVTTRKDIGFNAAVGSTFRDSQPSTPQDIEPHSNPGGSPEASEDQKGSSNLGGSGEQSTVDTTDDTDAE